VATHQLQVERRTRKVRQSETDVLPLCYATNLQASASLKFNRLLFALQSFHFCNVYRRDAMLARLLALALCLCLSLCLSVTSRSSIEAPVRIELVFGVEASFDLSYAVLKGNSGTSKTWVLLSRTLLRTPDLEFLISSKRVINLDRQRWTLRAW